jgi:putative hemolysin
MGDIWIGEALKGVSMMNIKNLKKCTSQLSVLCLAILLAAVGFTGAEQIPLDALNTSGPDSAYCISMGYSYTTVPGANNGRPVCQFPDNSWCDAHSFFTGDCTPSPSSSYNPYYNSNPMSALDIADATKLCQKDYGQVQTVHTAYGDVSLCVFPGGNAIDLRALYNGVYGVSYDMSYAMPYNAYNETYLGPGPYTDIYGDRWYNYAYSWMNAP